MPKKTWASEEQQTWLSDQLADFRKAQEAKTTAGFFMELYQNFHDTWPLAPPNAEELSKEDGNEEKATTVKQKASEHVSISFSLIVDPVTKMVFTYYQRLHEYIYNKSRGSSSGSGTRKTLKLNNNSRSLHPWQAFAKLGGE
jgi:ABC-type phosphate transport system substrate-binding protein